ncbi:5-formyltetrahydrofolate cyclo-ligase isoform X2 [Bemisia tabaci]|uniref:5-formyltetrahydrofolate cyclo-ligase isoform X2 n=1 Tax=Bemisia tabaci TaxID=7038 RepID=UPI003B28116D
MDEIIYLFFSILAKFIRPGYCQVTVEHYNPEGSYYGWTTTAKPVRWQPGEKIPYPKTTDPNVFRAEMRWIISKISLRERKLQSEAVRKQVTALKEFKNAKSIGIYLSKDTEIGTYDILSDAFDANKTCYVPRVVYKTIDFVPVFSMRDVYEEVPINQLSIQQPTWTDKKRVNKSLTDGRTIDLLILPGLAFTRSGSRFPDGVTDYIQQFIRKAREMCDPFLIGLCLRQQVVKEGSFPTNHKDAKMDKVIWDKLIYKITEKPSTTVKNTEY